MVSITCVSSPDQIQNLVFFPYPSRAGWKYVKKGGGIRKFSLQFSKKRVKI
jgi:hypothetical protein